MADNDGKSPSSVDETKGKNTNKRGSDDVGGEFFFDAVGFPDLDSKGGNKRIKDMVTGGHSLALPTGLVKGISSPLNPSLNSLTPSPSVPTVAALKDKTKQKPPCTGMDRNKSTTLLGDFPGTWGMLVSQDIKIKATHLSGNSFLIGRNKDSNIVFNEQSNSTSMCKLWFAPLHGKLVILEHLSSTGTLRHNDKLYKRAQKGQLRSGDEIVLYTGATTLTLYFVAEEETVATSKELSGMCSNGKTVSENFKNMCRDISNLNGVIATNTKAEQGPKPVFPIPTLLSHSKASLKQLADADFNLDNSPFRASTTGPGALEACEGNSGDAGRDFFPKLSAAESAAKAELVAAIRKHVLNCDKPYSPLDRFPYFLSDHVKFQLKSICFMHLKKPEFSKFTSNVSSMSPRILLAGPAGTESMREQLVKCLAVEFKAKLLCFPGFSYFLRLLKKCLSKLEEEGSIPENADIEDGVLSIIEGADDTEMFKIQTGATTVKPLESETTQKLGTADPPSKNLFKKGDRVEYFPILPSQRQPDIPTRGPPHMSRGKVCEVFEGNPHKVGVGFDHSFPGGINFNSHHKGNCGFICKVSDLRQDSSPYPATDRTVFETLIEVVSSIGKEGPLILFFRTSENSILDSWVDNTFIKNKLDNLQGKLVIIRSTSSAPDLPKTAVARGAIENLFETLFKEELAKAPPTQEKILPKHFPNKVTITAPQDPALLSKWEKKLQEDIESFKARLNGIDIGLALSRCKVNCPDVGQLDMPRFELGSKAAERIVGWAVGDHLMCWPEPAIEGEKLIISKKSIETGLEQWKVYQKESDKAGLKEISPENEFEKRILSEVIPPNEIGVSFSDIGALDSVKTTLKELVMLPLQRPELFQRGQLTKPCKGILLFGPPGTGKTMLAKAVATEASANFINISMSAIASKWIGDGEKYVKAIFTLASKIAPSVIFIDEVDSMLSSREQPTEHEAMRRMKNEFMAHWDGLKTRAEERILVLAATNRPFDLDDAVIRRLPRRLMVSLPDAENRAKILKVILGKEELETGFDFAEVASMADGFSGSDLKNLCVTAAYRPIREILEREELESAESKLKGGEVPPLTGRGGKPVQIRCLNVDDFKQAMKQVGASVSSEAVSLQALQQWNEQYGDGGSRKKAALSYFL